MRIIDQSQIEVIPVSRPLVGEIQLPGSKSITNRALLIAALSKGDSRLSCVLASDDTSYMAAALRAMGVRIVEVDPTTVCVRGTGKLSAPPEPLFLGNAGTATRFLTAAAAMACGKVVVDGDEQMRKRPIRPLVDALCALGVDAMADNGCPPVVINGRGGFAGSHVEVDANSSSQYVSALMILAACGGHPVEISLRNAGIGGRGYIDLTIAVMEHFGARVRQIEDEDRWSVEPTGYTATDYVIEPDASSCTYFWAAEALTHGRINLQGNAATMTQPDAKAHDLIRMFPHLPHVIDGSQIQDSVPTLAVLAAFNEHSVRFTGIGNLRVKECDRIRALSTALCQIKKDIATEIGDDLIVNGHPGLTSTTSHTVINTWKDHRIAMSFALAGLRVAGIIIDDPGCVSKTFPSYWEVLAGLGVKFRVPG